MSLFNFYIASLPDMRRMYSVPEAKAVKHFQTDRVEPIDTEPQTFSVSVEESGHTSVS
jgi:hypothetical protein